MTSLNALKADARARLARAKNKRERSDRRIRQGEDVPLRTVNAAISAMHACLSPPPNFASRFAGKALCAEWEGCTREELFEMVDREESKAAAKRADFETRLQAFTPPVVGERDWLTVQPDIDELERRCAETEDQRHIDEYQTKIERLKTIEEVLAFRRVHTRPKEWVIAVVEAFAAHWGELVGKPQDLTRWAPDWTPTKTEVREKFHARQT